MVRPAEQDAQSSLAKGLSLLEEFSTADTELSISELARRSGIPKSTTHRLVKDLVSWGAMEQSANGYTLGLRLFEMGHLVPRQRRFREVAIPYAHALNEVTKLTANLAVRDGYDIIYVDKISSPMLQVPHSRTGGRLPVHCTALGKAILAFSDQDFVETVLSSPLEQLTSKTIIEPTRLRKVLAGVRTSRVAYDVEESQPGLFCVAAPIFGPARQVAGAISVTGATALAQARRFAPTVLAAAVALSRILGEPQVGNGPDRGKARMQGSAPVLQESPLAAEAGVLAV